MRSSPGGVPGPLRADIQQRSGLLPKRAIELALPFPIGLFEKVESGDRAEGFVAFQVPNDRRPERLRVIGSPTEDTETYEWQIG